MSVIFEPETAGPTKVPPLSEPPMEARILELAADILETEGWTRGNYATFGRRCAVGSIGAATRRLSLDQYEGFFARRDAEERLALLVCNEFPRAYGGTNKDQIVAWNDLYATGRASVVRKMREAAASLTCRQNRKEKKK